MPIEREIHAEGDVVYVKAWGVDDGLEEAKEYGREVASACETNDCNLVLTDERDLKYLLSTTETYLLAQFYCEMAPKDLKVAVVCGKENYRDGAFWENVAVNRGLLFKAFVSVEEARSWLLGTG